MGRRGNIKAAEEASWHSRMLQKPLQLHAFPAAPSCLSITRRAMHGPTSTPTTPSAAHLHPQRLHVVGAVGALDKVGQVELHLRHLKRTQQAGQALR